MNQPSLPTPFCSVLVAISVFMALSTVFHSVNSPDNSPHSHYLLPVCPRGLTFSWWGCYGSCLRHEPTELAHSFLFCCFVYFCLSGPFKCISFHTFSRQLSVFSLCSAGLISTLLFLSTVFLFMKSFFSPDLIPSG